MTDAMSQFPAPLVAAEVDLTDFADMMLDVRKLRDSRFAAQVTGDAFRAGVLLWCAAWHQVPCGSLPDDDIELASLAGYGRFVKEWRKSRDEALMGFVKCSDGRLYHETVAEKANAAWTKRLEHYYERARDRLRKANKDRASKGLEVIPEISFEAWNAQRLASGTPMEKADASAGTPQISPPPNPGIPPESALKGEGEGEGKREGEGEGLDKPFPPTPAPPPGADLLGDSPPPPPAPPAPSPKPATRSARAPKAEQPPVSAATWNAYATAFADRYSTQPVRNAKVNAQLGQLVQRLGAEEAPRVAAFYVGHRRADYVRATHPVDLLLRDCEGLRTQWAAGRQTTNAEAQQVDRTQTNANAFSGMLAEAAAREAKEKA